MIADTITKQIAEAMKARDEIRLSTLRLLSSALNYEFIAKQHKLSDEEELAVVRKEARKRKDAIEALRQAQGKLTSSGTDMGERIKREEAELAILEEYLPEQMSVGEIAKIVDEVIAESGAKSLGEIGMVIGRVMAKVAGRADGKVVSDIVRQKLS
jgi:uncharacterized protein YqeY